MNHLDIMAGSGFTNPIAARFAVDLCSGLLEDLLDSWPSSIATARHEGRTMTCSLLTTGDTRSNKKKTFGFTLLCAADGIRVVRVATIDDDVAFLEVGCQLNNEIIDSISGLHEEDDFAGPLELGHELLDGMSTLDVGALSPKLA